MNRDERRRRRRRAAMARHVTIDYHDGKPTPHAEETLERLGVTPAFVGESMTCEICGCVEQSTPHAPSNWRVLDVDGERSYFCPREYPEDGASKDSFHLAYQRSLAFAMAKRNPALLAALKQRGLNRPVAWGRTR